MQINSIGFLNSQLDMAAIAKIIVEYCADVKPGENVVVVSDDAQSRNVYMSLTAAAALAGAEASLLLYPTPKPDIPGNRIIAPKAVVSVVRDADVIIQCGMRIPRHDYRVFLESKARVLMMTGMTEESLIRTTPVDYEAISEETARLLEVFNKTHQVHITCPMGSDINMGITGALSTGAQGTFRKLKVPVASPITGFDFLPAGRIGTFLEPHKHTANGIIKLKSFLGLGVTYGTVNLDVKDARVTEVKGEGGAEQWYVENLRRLLFQDENSNYVCEVGVGLNPAARLTGCYEDYGLRGSARFGFGEFGEVKSILHSDGFVMGATMELDGKALIRNGEYV